MADLYCRLIIEKEVVRKCTNDVIDKISTYLILVLVERKQTRSFKPGYDRK